MSGPDSHERAVAPEQEHDIAPGAHGGHAPDRHPGPDPAKRRAVEGLEHAGAIHHVHPFSVGTERRMQLNAPGELLDRDLTTRGGVPDPQALVAGGRQQPARVGRPSCAPDVGEAGRPGCLVAGGEIDEPESFGLGPGQGVPVRRRQREAVGGALDGRGVLPEGHCTRNVVEVPRHQVLTSRIQGPVVRGPGDARPPHSAGHCEAVVQQARRSVPDDHPVVARGGREEVSPVRVAAAFG